MSVITTETFSRLAGQVPSTAPSGGASPAENFLSRLSAMQQGGVATATHKPIGGSDYGMYANVVIGGKVVASLSNSGCCLIADGYGGAGMGAALDLPGTGPKLAQQRAEIIARALGGTVETLPTAQTAEQWAMTGKTPGKIDLWGLDGDEPDDYRPQLPSQAMDVLLREQEGSRASDG